MERFKEARRLAEEGFYLFPCIPDGKTPALSGWQEKATRELPMLEDWFLHHDYNVGISTSRFGDNKACVVIDVDNKGSKHGDSQILRLEMEGCELPSTLEQRTPTGGRHLIYFHDYACKQGVDVLGEGLDIRSRGGYIVGPGSSIGGRAYEITRPVPPMPAPDWLVHRLGVGVERDPSNAVPLAGVDSDRAISRAIEWLKTAPVAIEGQGGDHTTFRVACQLKDFGVSEKDAVALLFDQWNAACEPPWSMQDLEAKVVNAYRYGREPQGATAPEAVFSKVAEPAGKQEDDSHGHPFDVMNREYAFILAGGSGSILWETTDQQSRYCFQLLNKDTFKDKLAAKKFQAGDKVKPLTTAWLEWEGRRSYDGLTFEPGRNVDSRWFNMWRGFVCEPAANDKHPMVDRWKEHLLNNVCNGNAHLADWLTGWFAHLVQKPYDKPLVALAFKGRKGTGKNALVERVGKLLGDHTMVTSRRRYLVSNFTMHLQKCLMFVLDEAFWSGDKEAEGVVKDLITGGAHVIEPKGKESYSVRNLTRVVVIGNEEWIIPASGDERRWAVFSMGEGKMQNRKYFEDMRIGLDEQGGNAHLLRYLLDYEIKQDVNAAPQTQGLIDQKHASLDLIGEWLLDSLSQNAVQGSDFGGEWPDRMPTNRMHDAFGRWSKSRNVRSRVPTVKALNKEIKKYLPSFKLKRARADNPGDTTVAWETPGIDVLRKDWEAFIGGKVNWENEE